MKINTPEYAKNFLCKFFKKNQIAIRDYSKVLNGEHWERGISVLAYDVEHSIGAWIDFTAPLGVVLSDISLANKIRFKIEENEKIILDTTWNIQDVDESVYEYFIFILTEKLRILREFYSHINKFKSKDWVKRNQQLSKLIEN